MVMKLRPVLVVKKSGDLIHATTGFGGTLCDEVGGFDWRVDANGDAPSELPRTRVWSWDFKFGRAEKHLEEVREYVAEHSKTRPYRSKRDLQADANGNTYTVRATLEAPADYVLATILGEFFYNLRSALDHMAVALVPPNRRRWASFPIALRDPWERDPETGQPFRTEAFTKARRSYRDSVRGMNDSAKATIKGLQPYRHGPNAERVRRVSHRRSGQRRQQKRGLTFDP